MLLNMTSRLQLRVTRLTVSMGADVFRIGGEHICLGWHRGAYTPCTVEDIRAAGEWGRPATGVRALGLLCSSFCHETMINIFLVLIQADCSRDLSSAFVCWYVCMSVNAL